MNILLFLSMYAINALTSHLWDELYPPTHHHRLEVTKNNSQGRPQKYFDSENSLRVKTIFKIWTFKRFKGLPCVTACYYLFLRCFNPNFLNFWLHFVPNGRTNTLLGWNKYIKVLMNFRTCILIVVVIFSTKVQRWWLCTLLQIQNMCLKNKTFLITVCWENFE